MSPDLHPAHAARRPPPIARTDRHRAVVLAALLATATAGFGQQATERYLPMGQSPGVSGKTAVMGTIVGYEGEFLVIASPAYATPQRVRLLPATRIWLDRHALQETSTSGSVRDLAPGRRVEIGFRDAARRDTAEWVKIEATR
jgi:hypothetical protein